MLEVTENGSREERKKFVHNLGKLLAQTRENIVCAELDDNDVVTLTYENGFTRQICVEMDSYIAIIRDVTKHL